MPGALIAAAGQLPTGPQRPVPATSASAGSGPALVGWDERAGLRIASAPASGSFGAPLALTGAGPSYPPVLATTRSLSLIAWFEDAPPVARLLVAGADGTTLLGPTVLAQAARPVYPGPGRPLLGQRIEFSRARQRLFVPLRCVELPPCRGILRVTARGRTIARGRFDLRNGNGQRVDVPLTRPGRRILSGRHRLTVTVRLPAQALAVTRYSMVLFVTR